MDEIRQILKEIEEMHPYRIPSIRESYDKYAEGWTDAVNEIESRLPVVPDTNVGNMSEFPNSSTLQPTCNQLATDCTDRQAVIDAIMGEYPDAHYPSWYASIIEKLPSAQPEPLTESEVIICKMFLECKAIGSESCNEYKLIMDLLDGKRSAQPEHTCLTCGRTVNNGGWYKDGRTRCPIEEHYALPKDGFCHLWEKRNVTDDDYPERRNDEPEK